MRLRTVFGAAGLVTTLTLVGGAGPFADNAIARSAPATAQSLAGLAGDWLVVPRRTPESVAIGGIPRTLALTSDGKT